MAARFAPPVMERIGWVSKSMGLTASKWLQDVAMAELARVQARIGAAVPGQEYSELSKERPPEHGGTLSAPMVSTAPITAPRDAAPSIPVWRPGPPKTPAWNRGAPAANWTNPQPDQPQVPEQVKPYACKECKDQGGGVLVECICGRYRDQQGNVQTSPDAEDGPRDWATAWKLLEGMDQVERAEKFFEWSKGRALPPEWRDMTRETRISWLNLKWPLT